MSNVRVLVGTRKGAFVLTADGKREKWDVSGPHLQAGKFITSRDRLQTPIGFMLRNRAGGLGRSFSVPTTAVRRGISREHRRVKRQRRRVRPRP